MNHAAPVISLAPELHAFVRLVLGDPAVQARLGQVAEAQAFVAEAVAVAADHAVALDPQVLQRALYPDPIGLGRYGSAPIELDCWPPSGWLPTRSVPTGGTLALDWLWFGERRLGAPFFEDDVRRAGAMPLNWLLRVRTSLTTLVAGTAGQRAVPLHGLIYHMSRCGSTLLAQMLGAAAAHQVLAEPEPLDAVLLWAAREQVPAAQAVPAVRAVVAALGRCRGTAARSQFVKLDAWHMLSLPLLREAFPETPWVYLFREPVEVLVSHQRQPGMHTVPGIMPAALFGIEDGQALPPLDYAANALEAIGLAALAGLAHGGGLAVDYPALPQAAMTAIAVQFGLSLSPADLAAMARAGRADAKAPERAFTPDSADKRAASTAAVHTAAGRLRQIHGQLLDLASSNS